VVKDDDDEEVNGEFTCESQFDESTTDSRSRPATDWSSTSSVVDDGSAVTQNGYGDSGIDVDGLGV